MTLFSCTKIGNSWYSNSNERISLSFYPLVSFEIYVREQTRKFEKMKKKIEVGQLHLEVLATSENMQYIYFIYTLWGAIVGSEVAQLQKKFFLRIH